MPTTLLDALSATNSTVYTVGSVLEIQSSLGTVSLNWLGGITLGVPYLLSYSPAVGDKVQVLNSEAIGLLVLGKTTVPATPPAPPVTRLAFLPPTRSMTWSESCVIPGRVSMSVGPTRSGVVTEGYVTQGADLINVYSGAYVYPFGLIHLASGEILTKAEILVARVDSGDPYTTSPLLHELVTFDGRGKPVVINPTLAYPGRDLLPGDAAWQPIPVLWVNNILNGTSDGVTFAPTTAQQALTFAEYESYTRIAGDDEVSTSGTLRLTITQNHIPGPVVAPVAKFTASVVRGNGPLTVAFVDQSTRFPTTWFWDFGDGTTSSAQSPAHVYSTVGNYTVKLTVTNTAGANTSTRVNFITVGNPADPPVAPVANFAYDPSQGDTPFQVSFTDTSTNAPTTWSWGFGDGEVSLAKNPQHTYNTGGTFDVKLIVGNAAGTDQVVKSQIIKVKLTVPPAPTANFTFTPSTGVDPLTVQFTDSSTHTPTSWSWTFGDGKTSLAQNPSHTYTSAGTFSVKLTAKNATGSTSITKSSAIRVTADDDDGGTIPPPTTIVNYKNTTPHVNDHKSFAHIVQFDYLSSAYPTKLQSGAGWDPQTGDWFEAQEKSSTHDMYVHRFDSTGNHISSMLCINGGHGSSMAVQRSGSTVYIWFNWDDGGAHFVRIPYTPQTQHLSDAQILKSGETSGTYCLAALDTVNDLAGIRFVKDGDDHYKVVRISDILAGHPTSLGPIINAGSNSANIFQGMAMHKDSVYKISGPSSSKADYRAGSVNPVYIWEWDWRSAKLLAKKNFATAANYSGDIVMSSEPEGLEVINHQDYPVLTAIFKRGSGVAGDADRRRMRVVGITPLSKP